MAFFEQAITVLQTLVIALGAGLGIWGVINLLEGYGNDNPGAKAQGGKGAGDKRIHLVQKDAGAGDKVNRRGHDKSGLLYEKQIAGTSRFW